MDLLHGTGVAMQAFDGGFFVVVLCSIKDQLSKHYCGRWNPDTMAPRKYICRSCGSQFVLSDIMHSNTDYRHPKGHMT